MRLDKYLTVHKLTKSRTFARELIENSAVTVNDRTVNKAAFEVKPDDRVEITSKEPVYVSRAALKLKAAIDYFKIDLKDKTVMDIGSSTGGFTQYCLLSACQKVVAIDVGKDQLDPQLRHDQRIILKENTDIRDIDKKELPCIDFICCDVSFISLRLVLPKISEIASGGCDIICLFKPQFEVGAKNLNKTGVVKDQTLAKKVLKELAENLNDYGLALKGALASPILGKSGNQEYLLWLKKGSKPIKTTYTKLIDKL